MTLLGPSGVGKTRALLRAIAGLLPGALGPRRRRGRWRGGSARRAPKDLLLPWLSALDNALLGHRLRGVSRAELKRLRERGRELLERVGLGGREGGLPATLSGG